MQTGPPRSCRLLEEIGEERRGEEGRGEEWMLERIAREKPGK